MGRSQARFPLAPPLNSSSRKQDSMSPKPVRPKTKPPETTPSLMHFVELTVELKRQSKMNPEKKKLLQRFFLGIPSVDPMEAQLLMNRLAEQLALVFKDAQIKHQKEVEEQENNPAGLILPASKTTSTPSGLIIPPGAR